MWLLFSFRIHKIIKYTANDFDVLLGVLHSDITINTQKGKNYDLTKIADILNLSSVTYKG